MVMSDARNMRARVHCVSFVPMTDSRRHMNTIGQLRFVRSVPRKNQLKKTLASACAKKKCPNAQGREKIYNNTALKHPYTYAHIRADSLAALIGGCA